MYIYEFCARMIVLIYTNKIVLVCHWYPMMMMKIGSKAHLFL